MRINRPNRHHFCHKPLLSTNLLKFAESSEYKWCKCQVWYFRKEQDTDSKEPDTHVASCSNLALGTKILVLTLHCHIGVIIRDETIIVYHLRWCLLPRQCHRREDQLGFCTQRFFEWWWMEEYMFVRLGYRFLSQPAFAWWDRIGNGLWYGLISCRLCSY